MQIVYRQIQYIRIGKNEKEIVISKDGKITTYKYTNSALVKDIKWNLMREMVKKDLTPYEEYIKKSFYSEKYIRSKYPTEKEYLENCSMFSTYAVLTPDGEWYEPGKMGWWGMSNAIPEQEYKFEKNYEKNFIKTANPEWKLTIVDCHI